jgi:hypothetical protein
MVVGQEALADPCGFVPPPYINAVPLARTGVQRTYVFWKDGVETIAIRPGFTGKVEEFGMLVPLPSPPEIKKMPDEFFTHIASAIDPPEVVIDLRPQRWNSRSMGMPSVAMSAAEGKADRDLAFDEVRVLKQEAVGMYEVAVLEAGSAKALDKWMTEHKFKYPAGMDAVVNDYVASKWCFVAVKTRIGPKAQTDPVPGMKNKPKTEKPPLASFDGYIQGMGFRFTTPKAVVPMRLATYNKADDRRQIVYVLTSEPVKFEGVPESRVVRQIDGAKLGRNVTGPLPLRILGGKLADVPKERLEWVRAQREPGPHNGSAKELFAGDLQAARTKELSMPHEEEEKELLNIGERLMLRGPEVDVLHAAELAKSKEEIAKTALADLRGMSLTVVDGEFPFELMQKSNLTFAAYSMPKDKNNDVAYDAKNLGPGWAREGVLVEGHVDPATKKVDGKSGGSKTWYDTLWGN